MKKNGYHQLKIKSSIRVAKSARIIGVIFIYIIDYWLVSYSLGKLNIL